MWNAGYHWFPQSYVNAVSSSYCAANPQTTDFYAFAKEWAKTDPAATVPSTTASNILGTQTAASLYYTYAAVTAAASKSANNKGSTSSGMATDPSLRNVFAAALMAIMLFSRTLG